MICSGVGSMCKIILDYIIEYKIKIVKNLLKMEMSLDEALETVELDLDTYKKYSSEQ